jgi:hypothetical protein
MIAVSTVVPASAQDHVVRSAPWSKAAEKLPPAIALWVRLDQANVEPLLTRSFAPALEGLFGDVDAGDLPSPLRELERLLLSTAQAPAAGESEGGSWQGIQSLVNIRLAKYHRKGIHLVNRHRRRSL